MKTTEKLLDPIYGFNGHIRIHSCYSGDEWTLNYYILDNENEIIKESHIHSKSLDDAIKQLLTSGIENVLWSLEE